MESWRRGFQNSTPIKRAGDATPLPVTCLPIQGWFFQMTLMFVVPMCMWHCVIEWTYQDILCSSARSIFRNWTTNDKCDSGSNDIKRLSSRPLVIPSPLFLAGYKVLFIWKPVRMLMQWCRARTRIWSNLQTKPRPIPKNMDILYSIHTAYYVVRLWNALSMCLSLQESGFSHGGIWKPNDENDSVLLVAFKKYSTCLVGCWLQLVSTFCPTG